MFFVSCLNFFSDVIMLVIFKWLNGQTHVENSNMLQQIENLLVPVLIGRLLKVSIFGFNSI